jgi:hypothetical protein
LITNLRRFVVHIEASLAPPIALTGTLLQPPCQRPGPRAAQQMDNSPRGRLLSPTARWWGTYDGVRISRAAANATLCGDW